MPITWQQTASALYQGEINESGIRIRIRGNSTGVNNPQHPYKLKLTKKADLISPHYPVAPNKEWVLLNATNCHKDFTNEHTSILAWVGRSIGRILQMDYVPRTNFVNVVINGKYEGLYTRCEPDQFASCHNQNVFYFQKLFEYPEFCKIYRELYQAIRPKLVEAFENEMQQIIDTYSTAYEESMAMHKLVFKNEGCAPLANQAEEAVGLLQKRLTFLDEMIPKLTAVDNVEMGNDNRPVAVYDLNGLRHSIDKLPQLPRGVYLIRYANGQVVRKLAGK